MTDPQSRFIQSGRLRLHYAVWGDESKPPLLLLHGSRDHARTWDFVAEALVDRFLIYALDLRGHGDSEWSTGGAYRLNDHILDLANLVESLGHPSLSFIGHSLGARIILDYAGAFPEKIDRLVSIEAFEAHEGFEPEAPAADEIRGYVKQVRQIDERTPRAYSSLAEAEARMQEANNWLSPELAQHLTKHGVRSRDDGNYVWKFDSHVYANRLPDWSKADIRQIWQRIQTPTLFLGGEGWGRSIHPAFVSTAVKDARVEIIEGAGHWVHHDQFDRFIALVRGFMA